MNTAAVATLDVAALRHQVQEMYHRVANEPAGEFHFEMGRGLAERLGYPSDALDEVPAAAIESFAGVGYFFDLLGLRPGETVLDLGSGSGMDTLLAARQVGPTGRVIGVDMTDAQLQKAATLSARHGFDQVELRRGLIEEIPLDDASVDAVISNGVINLCPDKARVFGEIARVLRPGGRMAIADIVTERSLPEGVTCNATLWAACIGGAARQDVYRELIEAAGLRVTQMRDQPEYTFVSRSAQGAARDYGVKSVSLLAVRPA